MFFLRKSRARQTTTSILVSDRSSCLGPVWLGYYGLSVGKVPGQSKREKERQERDFPGCPVVKNPPANAGDTGWVPGMGRFHVQRSHWARVPQLLSLCSTTRENVSHSVVSNSVWPHVLKPARLLCSQGILPARILEWVAMPSSRGSFQFRDWTQISHIASRFFTIWATREGCSSNYRDLRK